MKIKRNIFFIFILLLVVIVSFQNAYAADGTVVSQIVEKFYNDSAKRMSGIHLAIQVFSKGYRPKQGKVAP